MDIIDLSMEQLHHVGFQHTHFNMTGSFTGKEFLGITEPDNGDTIVFEL